MSVVKIFLILLLFQSSFIFGSNVAIIADGTGSLEKLGILRKYKEGLKTVIELIGVIDPQNFVTFVKFGDDNENKIVFSGNINLKNIGNIFSTIENEWNSDKLYRVRTSFYSGFSAVLKRGLRYDLTIFITDGFHNSKRKDLEDFKKEFGDSLKNLGKVLILHIKPSGGKLSGKAEKIIQQWAETLNAEIVYTETKKLIQTFINLILKHRIENYIVGYGTYMPTKLTLNKYYRNSTLHIIVYPAVKIDGEGNSYSGYKISYVQIKGDKGEYTLILGKGWKKKFIFYYETGNYSPYIKIEPKKDYYFKGESVRIYISFKANNKEIIDGLFKSSMKYQFKLNNTEFPVNKLVGNEIISLQLKEKGILGLYMRFSPFGDSLIKKEYTKIYTFTVKKESNFLNIRISPEEVYEFQELMIKAEPIGLKISSPAVRIEGIRNQFSKIVNLQKNGNIFTASLALNRGTYRIVPLGNFKIGGETVINVHPRNLVIEIYKCESEKYQDCELNEDYSLEYNTSVDKLLFSLPVYTFMDGNSRFYKVKIKLDPLFEGEYLNFKFGDFKSLKFKNEFEYYPLFQLIPIAIGKKESSIRVKLAAFQHNDYLELYIKLSIPKNLRLISETPVKKIFDDMSINLNEEKLGKYEVFIGLVPVGHLEFSLYRTYIIIRNLIGLGVLGVLILIILYIRKRHLLRKKGMVRDVARYRGDEFWEELPRKVKEVLGNDKKNLKNIIYNSELATKVAKAWDIKHLKKFLEKLKNPKENVEVEIGFNTPVEVYGFVSENWETNNTQIFLRDVKMKGESFSVTLKKDVEVNENMWEIHTFSSNFRLEGEKFSSSGKISLYKDRVEGYFGNYKFILKMIDDKGILRLYRLK